MLLYTYFSISKSFTSVETSSFGGAVENLGIGGGGGENMPERNSD